MNSWRTYRLYHLPLGGERQFSWRRRPAASASPTALPHIYAHATFDDTTHNLCDSHLSIAECELRCSSDIAVSGGNFGAKRNLRACFKILYYYGGFFFEIVRDVVVFDQSTYITECYLFFYCLMIDF